MTHEEAVSLARRVLDGAVYSPHAAAAMLSEYVLEWAKNFKDLGDNLTSTQARCTELLEETRQLKREQSAAFRYPADAYAKGLATGRTLKSLDMVEDRPICSACGGDGRV